MLLCTGGLGFIGSHLAYHFKDEGYDVAVMDNRKDDYGAYHWTMMGEAGIERFHDTILSLGYGRSWKVPRPKDVDTIIHCAGQVAVTKSIENPRKDFEANVRGTFEVCEFARKNDAAVYFTSSNKVYSDLVNKLPMRERSTRYEFGRKNFAIDELFPIGRGSLTPYGVSKLTSDLYVQDYHNTYGLKTAVFRLSCIYGSDQAGTEDQGWVSHFVRSILYGKDINVYGNGKQVRDILYIDDLVELFDRAVKKDVSGVFNVGGGKNNTISVLELIETLLPEAPREVKISYRPWRLADQKVYISDISKAKKTYGWEPTITPEEGIGRLINYIKLGRDSVRVK